MSKSNFKRVLIDTWQKLNQSRTLVKKTIDMMARLLFFRVLKGFSYFQSIQACTIPSIAHRGISILILYLAIVVKSLVLK